MRLGEKVLWGAVALVLALIAATWYIFATVNIAGDCGADEVSRSQSPNRKHDAVVYTLNCGATTGYTTQVAVLTSGEIVPAEGGNVVTFDGVVPVQLLWTGSDSLKVTYHRAELFHPINHVRGVDILYDSLGTNDS